MILYSQRTLAETIFAVLWHSKKVPILEIYPDGPMPVCVEPTKVEKEKREGIYLIRDMHHMLCQYSLITLENLWRQDYAKSARANVVFLALVSPRI